MIMLLKTLYQLVKLNFPRFKFRKPDKIHTKKKKKKDSKKFHDYVMVIILFLGKQLVIIQSRKSWSQKSNSLIQNAKLKIVANNLR